jgi:hypothetical protein
MTGTSSARSALTTYMFACCQRRDRYRLAAGTACLDARRTGCLDFTTRGTAADLLRGWWLAVAIALALAFGAAREVLGVG